MSSKPSSANWWEIRPAQNRKPSTYRCPICKGQLPALMPHALIKPEGDSERRRHAHSECVARERRAGRMPTRDEYETARRQAAGEPEPAAFWRRLFSRRRA